MKATLTKLENLMGAKSDGDEIQAELEVVELSNEDLEGVSGGVVVVMNF